MVRGRCSSAAARCSRRRGGARAGAQPRRRAARGRAGRHRAVDDGTLGVAGVPSKSVTWAEVATKASDDGFPLAVEHDFVQSGASFPFGAHVSVVEVDTETGRVEPIRHIAVDDCGRILNPMLVDGQVHGGLASGISQALWEEMVYDDDGNPLTSTLAEYAIPSAAEFPHVRGRAHRDAVTAQPARRQGHRRVGHGGQHARGAERGGRRAQPPRRAPHRHAVQPRAGVAHHRGRPGRHPARPVARAARRVRHPPRAPPAGQRPPRTTRSTSEPDRLGWQRVPLTRRTGTICSP